MFDQLFDCPHCTNEFLAVTDGRFNNIAIWIEAINSAAASKRIHKDELLFEMHRPHTIDTPRGRMVR